ncbi:translocation/assembly module TamB [Halomonas qinghailakensis]|uniref:Translocation/assembly module TamB n=1 Tax=Halomonas qinghailakensis TaxID=2937790 RepID=A0AA46TQK3_9GAMM|nr:translocation/assembly module TamB domain-containing protein [Halomonas sp. ZZQ-149]UYO74426.1 translocation/assembly module TamB [Halomonas sp. ZZQ-149]
MAKVATAASTKRQPLSVQHRFGLLLWSLVRLVIVLPLWLFGLIALLLGVALSPWGTGQLFSQGEQRGYFTYEHQAGALLDHFELQGFQLSLGETRINVDSLTLAWAEDCVLSGKLCLDKFHLEGADIRLGESTESAPESTESEGMPSIQLPFPIELRSVELNNVQLQLADGTRIGWESFSTAMTAQQHLVNVAPTTLMRPTLYLPTSAGTQLTEGIQTPLHASGIDGAIKSTQPIKAESDEASEALAARERIELPEIVLPIDIDLASLTVADVIISGSVDYQVERLAVVASAEGSQINLRSLELLTPDAEANLTASATLSGSYPLDAQLTSTLFLPEIFPELSGEELVLELSGSLEALTANLEASGVVDASLEAQVDALAPTLPFDLRLQSSRLQWPLTQPNSDESTAEPYIAEDIDIIASGSLEAYQTTLSLNAQGPQVPATTIRLSGDGDLSSFRWTPLTLAIDDSSLSSEGEVNWASTLRVDTTIKLEQFDPSHFIEQLNGNLNGNITASVRQTGDLWEVSLPVLDIDGQLQEYPLTLQAVLEANSALEVDIQELLFTQGDNRLTASGQMSEQAMSLDTEIALRQLQTLHPDLAGTLTGNILARGSFSQPRVEAELTGRDLQFAENRIDALSLTSNIDGIEDPSLDIDLGLQQVSASGQAFSNIALELNGRLSQHAMTVSVDGQADNMLSRAFVSLEGGFDQQAQQYQGQLTPLEVDSEFGNLRLEAPLDIRYSLADGQAQLSPFCIRREEGGIVCSEEPISASADQGRAVLSIREVPMEAVEPVLPEAWSLEGDTTADIVAAWRQGGTQWQADVQVLSELAITAVNDYGQPVQLPVIRLDTQLEANQAQADANILLSFEEAGELTLDLTVSDPLGSGGLNGELRAQQVSLTPYRPLVVGMDRLEGDLNGSIQISGTTNQPDLQGQLALRNLSVHGPDIPIDIKDGELVVAFDGEQGDINGFVAAERGRLNITGDAYWPAGDDWRIGVDVNAIQEPLLIVLPQFGRLEAAPDIRIRVTPDRLQVRGNVDLPWARLEVGDLPASAVSPSSDEVIITERDDQEAERLAQQRATNGEPSAADELSQSGMALDVLITLTLGRDMQISAYGLNSGLGGTLEIRQDSGALQLFGDVNLVDGRFQAFGQDLLIRRGQLIFSGPPGLPILDFEAIRNPDITEDEVIAGLRVSGNAEEPNVLIFSEPGMDETRALSYLLRGRAPDASGGGIDSALTTALIGMSLGRTGGAVGSIGEAFGISDLTLDTTGAGDNSQVALTGQLTDDIRISYGVGIFSPIAELTLRYTLWRNLYVQAVSGANQAVDLIYTFTRSGDPTIFPRQ